MHFSNTEETLFLSLFQSLFLQHVIITHVESNLWEAYLNLCLII